MNYKEEYKFGSDISYVFINKILPLLEDKKVLDLGCGTGEYLKYFSTGSRGYDMSARNIEEAHKNTLNVEYMDLNNPHDVGEKFDAVFLSHVLEHVECPLNLIRYMKNQLNPNGKLIIAVPNEYSFIHMVYPYFTQDGNHLYSFSVKNMKELLQYSGLKLENIYYDYYSALIQKYNLSGIVSSIDLLPAPLKEPFAWAYWFESTLEK